MPNRSAVQAAIALALIVVSWNCGGSDKSGGNAFDEAVNAVTISARPTLESWANDLANKASLQVTATGALDLKGLSSDAVREAESAKAAICKAIDENGAIRKPPEGAGQPDQVLEKIVKLQAARSLGRYPSVVYAAKPQWPRSWLRDGAEVPSYDADAKTIDPLFLKPVLQDRFVGADGAFLPPDETSPDSPTFHSWLKQSNNSFDVLLFALTEPVTSGTRECLA